MYVFLAGSLDSVLFFSDKGKVYQEKVYQIPDADRQAKGVPLQNVLALGAGERITAALPVRDFASADYIVMATMRGKIKRCALDEFSAVRPSGLMAITLEEGDTLGWAKLVNDQQHVVLITEQGRALRFPVEHARPMGRQAAGVNAIRLGDGDAVTSMVVCHPVDTGQVLVITTNGYGKRTALDEYPVHNRGGGGVATIAQRALAMTGPVTAARIVQPEDEITVVSAQGNALRILVSTVPESGRSTRGSRLMQLREGDTVASVARLKATDVPVAPAAARAGDDGAGQPADAPDDGAADAVEPVDGTEGQQESP